MPVVRPMNDQTDADQDTPPSPALAPNPLSLPDCRAPQSWRARPPPIGSAKSLDPPGSEYVAAPPPPSERAQPDRARLTPSLAPSRPVCSPETRIRYGAPVPPAPD